MAKNIQSGPLAPSIVTPNQRCLVHASVTTGSQIAGFVSLPGPRARSHEAPPSIPVKHEGFPICLSSVISITGPVALALRCVKAGSSTFLHPAKEPSPHNSHVLFRQNHFSCLLALRVIWLYGEWNFHSILLSNGHVL